MSTMDFVLQADQQVMTYGKVERQPGSDPFLHVAVWPSLEGVRVANGVVTIHDAPDDLDNYAGRLVRLSGAWDPSGAIRADKLQNVAKVPGLPACWGDEESLARAARLSSDESVSVYRAARENSCGLNLATAGGQSRLMVIKVLHVCSDLAYWHDQEGCQFITLAPAIIPEGLDLSTPPFTAAQAELKVFGLSD